MKTIEKHCRDFQGSTNLGEPLGFFITFRCYGSWLPGDDIGYIDKDNNIYDTPFIEPNSILHEHFAANLKHPPIHLNEQSRIIVEESISQVCNHRDFRTSCN